MMFVQRKVKVLFTAVIISVSALVASAEIKAPKYVFLFIGDGMSTPQRMAAETFSEKIGRGHLSMNFLPYQVNTRTKSANSIITDSAAAATAIACGVKTKNSMLGVTEKGERVESVAELAKKQGKKVGIATTVAIVHATPAGFYAHRKKRSLNYQIGLDLVASGFDYFCGSGLFGLEDDKKDPEYQGNIFDLARKEGYKVTTERKEWESFKAGDKVWAIFGGTSMDFAIDADGSEPTLAEIVAKGIEVLDGPEGFFFMCEGGKIDYACHANDAATNLRDILALDDAVKVALDFQEKHPEDTLIITTGDHETGGLSMGFAGAGGAFRVELLKHQKVSVEKFSEWFKSLVSKRKGELTFDDIKPVLSEKFGFAFKGEDGKYEKIKNASVRLTDKNVEMLKEAFEKDVGFVRKGVKDTTAHNVTRVYVFAQAAKNVLNAQAGVGWSSFSHTALPTLTTAKGAKADIILGLKENSDLGVALKSLYRE